VLSTQQSMQLQPTDQPTALTLPTAATSTTSAVPIHVPSGAAKPAKRAELLRVVVVIAAVFML
jgi:hypothetical protein